MQQPAGTIVARHSGDLGDIISSLLVFRQLGGGTFILSPHAGPHGPREDMTERKANWMLPLIAKQPYVSHAEFRPDPANGADVTHDFMHFRARAHFKAHENLALWHARSVGLSRISFDPWLTAEPSPRTAGKVLIARSARYHNPAFPWYDILRHNRAELCFVGSEEECAAIRKMTPVGNIHHLHCDTALSMAELIAGSRLFIGNQSLPCWIAMGLGAPLIQETWPTDRNSRIIRHNAHFVQNRTDYVRLRMKW